MNPPKINRLSLRACLAGLLGICLGATAAGAQTLEEALATAYAANPTLLAARARLRSVNEEVPQELSNWRPLVTLSASAGKQRIDLDADSPAADPDPETTTPLDAQLTVTQSIYRGGRTVAGTARAEADVQAERARLVSTEQGVLLDAVTSFMDVWRDQSVLRLNINNEQVLRRQLEASEDRFQVGEITRTDVAQSESRLARATADRVEAEGNLATSRAVFQQIIGVYPGILQQPPTLDYLPATQDDVVGAAVSDNPDLVAAKFDERSARHQVRVDIGQLLPEISVVGEISRTEEATTNGSRTDAAQISAQLTIPLYQQGFVSSLVRQDKQVASQRRLEVDESRRAVEQNAISAWEDLQTARAQISSFNSEVSATDIALEGVRQENAVGARTILDILDAEQEFLDAQVNLVVAQRDELVASYAVLAAMGLLTAGNLQLPVDIYDPALDYQDVRDRWFGLGIPGE